MARKSSLQDILQSNIEEHKNEMKKHAKSTSLVSVKPTKLNSINNWSTSKSDQETNSYKSPKAFRNVDKDNFSDRMFNYVLGADRVLEQREDLPSPKGPVILKSLDARCELKKLTNESFSKRKITPDITRLSEGATRSPERFHFNSPRYPSRGRKEDENKSEAESESTRELLPHYLHPRFKTQYSELIRFREENVRDKDEKERELLAGPNLVRHLEKRLRTRLENLKELGQTPNFRRLQAYAETFDELIAESWMFGPLLSQIKCAYDAEVERVLKLPVAQKELMQSEIEQLQKSIYDKEKLENLQSEVQQIQEAIEAETKTAEENKILFDKEEKKLQELIEEKARVDEEKRKTFKPEMVSNIPTEAEKLEMLKVQCWDFMDEISKIQKQTKKEMTSRATVVHLSDSLQDIGIKVEKLNSQKNQLEIEVASMTEELDSLLADADISEDNYKMIYSMLNEPSIATSLDYEESDKWNWYIS